MKEPLYRWAGLPLRANCRANTLNPFRPCDQDAAILDALDIGEILLVAANTERIDNPKDFSRLVARLIAEKIRVSMEMVEDYTEVLHISALEDRYPQDEYPHLWAEDDHGISSLEIRVLPIGAGGNIHVSYQGFLEEIFGFSHFPAWNSLQVVFHRGEWKDS